MKCDLLTYEVTIVPTKLKNKIGCGDEQFFFADLGARRCDPSRWLMRGKELLKKAKSAGEKKRI